MILAHNHPSGNLHPSESDKKLTKKILEAGKLLDINVIDHLIIGRHKSLILHL
jgi:DNA repair protein RadC